MNIKNAKLSFLVLFVLCVFSFSFFVAAQEKNENQNIFLDNDQDGLSDQEEKAYGTDPNNADTDGDSYSDGVEVKSGYNPLKSAPGDKIVPEEVIQKTATITAQKSSSKENLTQKMASKMIEAVNANQKNGQDPDLTEIQSITSDILNQNLSEEAFPEVKKEDLKIKKQNYKNLSEEKRKEKLKQDFTDYEMDLFYILVSNSPEPITSMKTVDTVFNDMLQNYTSAITNRNPDDLKKLTVNSEKILEQLKELEIPEDAVDLHIEAIKLASYSSNLSNLVAPNTEDPLLDVVNFSKIKGFVETVMGFESQFQLKLDEYGIVYNEEMQKQVKKMGIEPLSLEEAAALGIGTTASQ